MHNERLIFVLTRELYALKDKIELIRREAEFILEQSNLERVKYHAINIINEIDSGELYED